MLKNEAKNVWKLNFFIFRKMAPNSFYEFEIHFKPVSDTWKVIRMLFWHHRLIWNNFLRIEFLTSRSHFCLLTPERAKNKGFSRCSEYGRGKLKMSFLRPTLSWKQFHPHPRSLTISDFWLKASFLKKSWKINFLTQVF